MTRYFGEPAVDDYFHLPLWIQSPCCGHTLWAYNWRHLEFIESFVKAALRDRRQDSFGWSKRSMVTRLPRWMKAATNREQILDGIGKLRELCRVP